MLYASLHKAGIFQPQRLHIGRNFLFLKDFLKKNSLKFTLKKTPCSE